MDKLEKVKELLKLIQNDTITPKQVEEFLVMVLNVIKTSKTDFEKISNENIHVFSNYIYSIKFQNEV